MKKIRVFINGFGRIGRACMRHMLTQSETFDVVGINDVFDPEQYAYLLRYDSVYGPLRLPVSLQDGLLHVGATSCRVFSEPRAETIDFASLGVDVLLQCTGMHLSVSANEAFLDAGARTVVVSAPPNDAMPMFVAGINADRYGGERIVSAASCSAVAIAPLLQVFHQAAGVACAAVSMVHSYTAEQRLLDGPGKTAEYRRLRSATANILPLASSAAATVQRLLPELDGRIDAHSIRVPLDAGTLYDFTLTLERPLDAAAAKKVLHDAEKAGRLSTAALPLASSDVVASPANIVVQTEELRSIAGNHLRLVGWQDNEFGYAAQMLRLVEHIASVL